MQPRHSRSIIIAGFTFILMTTLVVGANGLIQLNRYHQQQQHLDDSLIIKRDLLTTMLSASRERAISLTMISSLEDPFKRDEETQRYNTLGAQFAAAREALTALELTPEEISYLERQGEVVAKGLESQHKVVDLAYEERLDEARALLTESAIPTQQQVFSLLQQLYDAQADIHQLQAERERTNSRSTLLYTLLISSLISLLIGGVTVLLVLRQIGRTEAALFNANERFDLAMRGANDGLWDWDINSNQVYFSPRWKEMLGYNDEELGNEFMVWEERVHPDDLHQTETEIGSHLYGDEPLYENIHRMRHRDGSYRWQLERGIAVRDKNGKPYRMVGTSTDITRLKETEEALFEEKERALVTLHSIGDAVVTTDHRGHVTYLNPIAERLTGWSNHDARGIYLDHVCPLIDDDQKRPVTNPVHTALLQGEIHTLRCATSVEDRHQHRHAITASAAPIKDSQGNTIGAIMVLRDVSESRELARRLTWQASHDALTGLYNRQELEQRLNFLLDEAQRDDVHHAFLYLDLDQFKLVNDTCGHLAGDELLRQLSYLLKRSLRETDTLARLGGDEFGVLLNHCGLEKAQEIANHLRNVVQDFRFVWQEKSFTVGVSIGIVPIDFRSTSSAAVMSAADIACYAAKDLGRNRAHLYVPDDTELARRHTEMEWVSRIRSALAENRLILYRHAIVSIQSETPEEMHTEILVRMVDENGETILPQQFIPAAERYNLMPLVDRKVIELALAQLAHDIDAPHSIAINLSGSSLGSEEFLGFVREQLQSSGVAPDRICFEITETAAITNLTSAMHFMGELKQMGCRFSLDDFGSGLSSFSYLQNLPVDYLKIDGSFIRDVVTDSYDRAMVEAISRVARVMGLKTIAEYVESEAILEELRIIGIDYAQGFAIEEPLPFSTDEASRKNSSA